MNNVSSKIRELRERRGWSQDQLGEMIGLKRSSIAMMEAGKRNVRIELGLRLSEAFGVTLNELYGEQVFEDDTSFLDPKQYDADIKLKRISTLYLLLEDIGIDFNEFLEYHISLNNALQQHRLSGIHPAVSFESVTMEPFNNETFDVMMQTKLQTLNIRGRKMVNQFIDILLDTPYATEPIESLAWTLNKKKRKDDKNEVKSQS